MSPLANRVLAAFIQVKSASERIDHCLCRHGPGKGLGDGCILQSLISVHACLHRAKEDLSAAGDIIDGLEASSEEGPVAVELSSDDDEKAIDLVSESDALIH